MKKININDLKDITTLNFNIMDEKGHIIFYSGEILNDYKCSYLSKIGNLFIDIDAEIEKKVIKEESKAENKLCTYQMPKNIESVNIVESKEKVNKFSKISPIVQMKIKIFYGQILENLNNADKENILPMYIEVRDRILHEIELVLRSVKYISQLKLLGDYERCHALNTAILSTALAYKLNLGKEKIKHITLGALLHDIGKYFENEKKFKTLATDKKSEHTILGYKIIKEKWGLPNEIARIALEHHETCNGLGYPSGLSLHQISYESALVGVCNYFDNLTTAKTGKVIENTRQALRVMLELGSQTFRADFLYTFIHMFGYNDNKSFKEMVL